MGDTSTPLAIRLVTTSPPSVHRLLDQLEEDGEDFLELLRLTPEAEAELLSAANNDLDAVSDILSEALDEYDLAELVDLLVDAEMPMPTPTPSPPNESRTLQRLTSLMDGDGLRRRLFS